MYYSNNGIRTLTGWSDREASEVKKKQWWKILLIPFYYRCGAIYVNKRLGFLGSGNNMELILNTRILSVYELRVKTDYGVVKVRVFSRAY